MGLELFLGLISVVVLLICLFDPEVANRARLQEDRRYANMCAHLVKRITRLVTVYNKVTEEYTTLVMSNVVANPILNHIANEVPADIKQKAERDFCVQDSNKTEAVAMLQMQLTSMINQDNLQKEKKDVE
jgi:hypothetical protein